jgi:predicted AlkP superfamily phosphohydrolase/phosphomutase
MAKRKVFVLGLDSVPASLLFQRFKQHLPNLRSLMDSGACGVLWSCDPPITIPAWMVMMTGKSPGRLGLYGFRHRRDNSYTDVALPTTASVREPTVWDILGAQGKHVTVVAVPPSYPPRRVNGEMVGCFMTPDTSADYTYPRELKQEIRDAVGEYAVDVTFRHEERDNVLRELYDMAERRFELFKHLLRTKPWDFFIGHEIGIDRLQHTFWKYFDTGHHLYEPGNRYESAILDYYRMLDGKVGELLELLDDQTAVMVVSDHGAQRMKGAFCVNQWLAREGYLAFSQTPSQAMPLEKARVDWARTRAWAWGGYYARIFVNLKGRESQGNVSQADYERLLGELSAKLKGIRGPNGEAWETQTLRPRDIYDECNADPPDLMVYFDDLRWRAAGTVGHPSDYLLENDTGPDDAVHSRDGVIVMANAGVEGQIEGARLADVGPTILRLMGVRVPEDMAGRVLI